MNPVVMWFRSDLRLEDNPALQYATSSGKPVLPVYVWNDDPAVGWKPGGAARWWLRSSLLALDASLQRVGARLIVRRGDPVQIIPGIVRETGADSIVWSAPQEPGLADIDSRLEERLRLTGVDVRVCDGGLLFSADEIRTREGKPFTVFTPFWRACLAAKSPGEPLPAPARIPMAKPMIASLNMDDLPLAPKPDWAGGLREAWRPGEAMAQRALDEFVATGAQSYGNQRDFPGLRGTSRLSPHLAFGEISPRAVWHRAQSAGAEDFLRQIGWREFAHHLLVHFPHTPEFPLRTEFSRFPWQVDASAVKAWQTGMTGYPIVDAGMRELWTTGWQHNRARMVTASFLTKHLLQPWISGAHWFWDTLVDADLANNTLGWQWAAGCGADAAPYFRIFNPVLQGERFDSDGTYVRRWVPELARLPNAFVHHPWDAPTEVLRAAEVRLGATYPTRVVDHEFARKRALSAYRALMDSRNPKPDGNER